MRRRAFRTALWTARGVVLAIVAWALHPRVAAAEPSPAEDEAILRVDYPSDIAITAFAGLGLAISEGARELISPKACVWCDRDASGGDSLNAFDREVRSALRWSSPGEADVASSVLAYGVAPGGAIGALLGAAAYDHRLRSGFADAIVVLQATAFALDVSQATKNAVGRARPDVHAGLTKAPAPDDYVSFFSGHAAATFALAVSSGTVASMRGYRLAPAVWAGGLAVAAVTSYLRLAADKHYMTDVLMGTFVGSSIGAAVPLLLHGSLGGARNPPVVVGAAPLAGGARVSVAGLF